MADCTKTVEFIREWKRMCLSNQKCKDCDAFLPIDGICRFNIKECNPELLEATARIVQKWSDEHPEMTWAGKLRELIPGADIETIIDLTCPKHYFGDRAPLCTTDAIECEDCWNGEYKEAEK